MYCNKCGSQNNSSAKFCVACGSKLSKKGKGKQNDSNSNNSKNEAGIRKAIKTDAKSKINGSFIGLTALYFVLCGMVLGITSLVGYDYNYAAINFQDIVAYVIITFLAAVLSYAIIGAVLNKKSETLSFSEIIARPFKNIDKTLLIFGVYLVVIFAYSVLGYLIDYIPFLSFTLFIILIVTLVFFAPTIEIILCLLADDEYKNLTFSEVIKKALELSKGHRVEYYGTMFSFVGWWLLSILTLGILYIWLIPYMRITLANMYQRWIGKANYDSNETGLSNGGVIGVSLGAGCGCMVAMTIFVTFLVFLIGFSYDGSRHLINDISNVYDCVMDCPDGYDCDCDRYFEYDDNNYYNDYDNYDGINTY